MNGNPLFHAFEGFPKSLIVRLHDLIRLDDLGKALNARGIAPGLELALPAHNASKAACPAVSRILCHDIPDRVFVHKLRMSTNVIQNGCEVDDRCQGGDVPSVSEILVPDDGFANCFGLRHLCLERREEIKRDDTTLEFKRQMCG